ncbi:MAG: hypothetical protein ACUVRL_09285 [Candidatus Saccharicenans sp.]|uniref:hypothetical protein n=1 Tax=Candidatus Saccharicenans sp. TaxID=2819258 RepID=UPI00404A4BE5
MFWPSFGQFRPEEILQRGELEDFLSTAKIVGFKDLRKGITRPIKLNLRKGNTERSAVWKNCSGVMEGYFEGWQYEIAAYRLDKLVGLNMIPPTIERRFQGQRASLQLWIEHKYDLLEIVDNRIPLPKEGWEAVNLEKSQYLSRAFDSLIANEDRSLQNTLFTEDWRTILIDHSGSFRSDSHFTKSLIYGLRPLRAGSGPLPFKRLPRPFVEKLRSLSFESIKAAVGSYLSTREIRSVLVRRDLIVKEIEEMIGLYGEGEVLY